MTTRPGVSSGIEAAENVQKAQSQFDVDEERTDPSRSQEPEVSVKP